MKSLKNFHRQSKYGQNRFVDKDKPYTVGISEVKEIAFLIDFLSLIFDLILVYYFGFSFIFASFIALMTHVFLTAIVSGIDTYTTRKWRIKMENKKNLKKTLDRFQLNK